MLELNRERPFYLDITDGLNIDLVNPHIYEPQLSKEEIEQLANNDPSALELANLVLDDEYAKQRIGEDPVVNVAIDPLEILALDQCTKSKDDKSKFKTPTLYKSESTEVSSYLLKTSIMNDETKRYGEATSNPLLIQDYDDKKKEIFLTGESYDNERTERLKDKIA